MSCSHYVALVGTTVCVPGTTRDELGGLGLQDPALRTGYVRVSFHRTLQNLKQHEYIVASVLDALERVCGGITVGVPEVRFSPALVGDVTLYFLDACRRLSEKLSETGCIHLHHGEFTLIDDTHQPTYLSKEG